MPKYPIDKKIVIAISSSALFDLTDSDHVYQSKGEDEYRSYQRLHQNKVLPEGVAFPFIKRFLKLNEAFPEDQPVEVILLSRNDPDTGLRVFHSIQEYDLSITRACFLKGKAPYLYLPAFNSSLFLSANQMDVKEAIMMGYPAGTVLKSIHTENPNDNELRIAFDFDGVLVDDEAESVYQKNHLLSEFQESEEQMASIPHNPGPLQHLFKKLSYFQEMERALSQKNDQYKPHLRTAIITARSAPAHERFVTTLRALSVTPDETFFLGGIDKSRILSVFQPHIFFDDQMLHLSDSAAYVPSVHVPFGINNK